MCKRNQVLAAAVIAALSPLGSGIPPRMTTLSSMVIGDGALVLR